MMKTTLAHTGTCFCGTIVIEVTGTPEAMGYCHCGSCRTYSGAPVIAFTLWKRRSVRIARGSQFLGRFTKSEFSHRRFCTLCGGHVMVEHPALGSIDVYAATIPTVAFTPAIHLNYAEAVFPMKDGLPKLKDFPRHAGGSGDGVPE